MNNAVLLLGAGQHPSQVIQRNFSILRNEENVIFSRKTSVEVKNTAIFEVEDHVSVEAESVHHHDGQEHKDGEVDADTNVSVVRIFAEVVGEAEVITPLPVLGKAIKGKSEDRIEHHPHSMPADDTVPKLREPASAFFHSCSNEGDGNEHNCVCKSTSNGGKYLLSEFVRRVIDINPNPARIKLGHGHCHQSESKILHSVVNVHAEEIQHDNEQNRHSPLDSAPHTDMQVK